ncbi:hypothetical protein CC80DRAFT_321034 [Byssothecium circinans]|uniref:Uncharacterized protein n=1 Tax=Byssothecium circinans TaxID=147558 RepID=A0A6A5U1U9_9PLEO|nr:hypothetical protein CC80DRAFT_321034 [Byssothecium circinans]
MAAPPLPIPPLAQSKGHNESNKSGVTSSWSYRNYPAGGSSVLSYETKDANKPFYGSPVSNRINFSAFINSMDNPSFAYFSLIREYASRPLQGYALHYESLYRALVSQTADEEKLCRVSTVEFLPHGTRSKTFDNYEEFKTYLDIESRTDAPSKQRRLFILEDLPVRYVCMLGSRFRIHPTVFARHFSTEDSSTTSNTLTTFPSCDKEHTVDGLRYETDDEDEDGIETDDAKRRFTLRYPIVMPHIPNKQHPDPKICPPWFKPSYRRTDHSAYPNFIVERVLSTPTRYDQWDSRGGIAELEGQVTYWSQALNSGDWNGEFFVSHVGL